MSEKHTPGLADAQRWMGVDTDPRWTVTLGGAVRFITAGDNDENNAIECKRRWNSHDALLEACKVVYDGSLSELLQYCIDHKIAYSECYLEPAYRIVILKAAIKKAEEK